MLLTLAVCYFVRPIVCHPVRRRKAFAILLTVLTLPLGATGQQPAHAESRPGETSPAASVAAEPTPEPGAAVSLFGRQQKLREGTVIPPTVGRVVNLGRRWAFVPMDKRVVSHREFGFDDAPPKPGQLSTLARVAADDDPVTLSRGVNLRWDSNPRSPQRWREEAQSGSQASNDEPARRSNEAQHIILCENQMLQRIVEATRADANDDRWEISGEILEFFDQNRLLIRTIQRAGSN